MITFKLECVELVIKQHNCCVSVANKKRVHPSSVKKRVRLYNHYGKDGLTPRITVVIVSILNLKFCNQFKRILVICGLLFEI
jgi:hypothetical protein